MENFNTIEEILDFAIDSEQQAVDFYKDLSEKSKNEDMKKAFISFMHEEQGHKKRLLDIKKSGSYSLSNEKVNDLKIAEYTVEVEFSENMDYQQALIIAMKKEKAAFKLYTDLSAKTDNVDLKTIFNSLAQDEAKHKLRFELEYDEVILREN